MGYSGMSVLSFPAFTARLRHAEHVMGTVVSFDVPLSARDDGSLDTAVRWLHWVDRIFSPFRPDSDVSLDSGTCRHVVHAVTAATGTLIRKIHRQLPASSSQPPRKGAIAADTPLNPAHVPIARVRSPGWKVASMMARLAGVISAPPTP